MFLVEVCEVSEDRCDTGVHFSKTYSRGTSGLQDGDEDRAQLTGVEVVELFEDDGDRPSASTLR